VIVLLPVQEGGFSSGRLRLLRRPFTVTSMKHFFPPLRTLFPFHKTHILCVSSATRQEDLSFLLAGKVTTTARAFFFATSFLAGALILGFRFPLSARLGPGLDCSPPSSSYYPRSDLFYRLRNSRILLLELASLSDSFPFSFWSDPLSLPLFLSY